MGKQTGNRKGKKNVFKVAGAQSFKVKNKAKSVSSQLKKLTEGTKKKTVEVDKLLDDLQTTVRKTTDQVNEKSMNEKYQSSGTSRSKVIEKYKEALKSDVVLGKLSTMEV